MNLLVFCEAEVRVAEGTDPEYQEQSCLSYQGRQR